MVVTKKDREAEIQIYRVKYLNLKHLLFEIDQEYGKLQEAQYYAKQNLMNSKMGGYGSGGKKADSVSVAREKLQRIQNKLNSNKSNRDIASKQLNSLFDELKSKRLKKRVVDDFEY